MNRRHVASGIAQAAGLCLVALSPLVLWPGESERAIRFSIGEGKTFEGRLVEPPPPTAKKIATSPVAAGTPVFDGDTTVGYVSRDLGEGAIEVRLLAEFVPTPETPLTLARRDHPHGIAWALRELVTSDVVEEFVRAVSKSEVERGLAGTLDDVLASIQKRMPEFYAANRPAVEREIGRLWQNVLSRRAEKLATEYVVPRVAGEVPFGDVAKDVLSRTIENAPGEAMRSLFGDDDAQAALKKEVLDELSTNPRLRDGLRSGFSAVWVDPGFRSEVGRALRETVTDPGLRRAGGDLLVDALQGAIPELETALMAELEKSADSGVDLGPVVKRMLLEEGGVFIRPALARVLRREILDKDRYVLEIVREDAP